MTIKELQVPVEMPLEARQLLSLISLFSKEASDETIARLSLVCVEIEDKYMGDKPAEEAYVLLGLLISVATQFMHKNFKFKLIATDGELKPAEIKKIWEKKTLQ
jgi:hypothetical protein